MAHSDAIVLSPERFISHVFIKENFLSMKLFRYILVIVITSVIFSCSGGSNFTVGYLNPAKDRVRFVKEGDFMAERLNELGIETVISFADDNDDTQLEQGYEMLGKGVDLIVIAAVNGNTIAPLVRDAWNQGVKVIAYNRLINNSDYDLFVTGDNAEIARIFCEGALAAKPSGNYVVFAGDRFDRNGIEVKAHVDSLLKPHIDAGRINLLYESYIEGWDRQRAEFEFQQVIDAFGVNIDAVISCNDPMGLGVIDVLKKYDAQNEVFVTGQDAILESVQSIYQGGINLTVYHPHQKLGYKTAELISGILQNGKSPKNLANAETFNGTKNIPTFRMKSMGINKDNLEELVNLKEYSWQQIRH
jgi:D-xylose transport system substrate-binding protein